jgi:hypothetical protein
MLSISQIIGTHSFSKLQVSTPVSYYKSAYMPFYLGLCHTASVTPFLRYGIWLRGMLQRVFGEENDILGR